jgi:hypothetical protein
MFIYERVHPEVLLIHLHGFASNVKSSKVLALRDFQQSPFVRPLLLYSETNPEGGGTGVSKGLAGG